MGPRPQPKSQTAQKATEPIIQNLTQQNGSMDSLSLRVHSNTLGACLSACYIDFGAHTHTLLSQVLIAGVVGVS